MHYLAKMFSLFDNTSVELTVSTHPVLLPGVGQWPLQPQDTGHLLQQEVVESIVRRVDQAVVGHILDMADNGSVQRSQ